MADLCRICGQTFTSLSFGGPGVCPRCDCGLPPQTSVPQVFTERYIGVTPDQVRQIVREEIERAGLRR